MRKLPPHPWACSSNTMPCYLGQRVDIMTLLALALCSNSMSMQVMDWWCACLPLIMSLPMMLCEGCGTTTIGELSHRTHTFLQEIVLWTHWYLVIQFSMESLRLMVDHSATEGVLGVLRHYGLPLGLMELLWLEWLILVLLFELIWLSTLPRVMVVQAVGCPALKVQDWWQMLSLSPWTLDHVRVTAPVIPVPQTSVNGVWIPILVVAHLQVVLIALSIP